jgi:hypothetical protein
VIVGIFLAFASLWFGVRQVTAAQVANTLVGRSVAGDRWEFGPCFWTMHTTFIPLLVYLSLVALCCVAKIFLSWREGFYRDASDREITGGGLNMTARFLAYLAVVIGGISGALKLFVH